MLVVCPHCKKMANAKDELLGKQVRCGQCKQAFVVQAAGAPDDETSRWNPRRVMERSGLHAKQITGVRGYADTRLRYPDQPLDARNRRISIVVQVAGAQ